MDDLRWLGRVSGWQWRLYDGDKVVYFLTITNGEFEYTKLFCTAKVCTVDTLEEAKRFVETQYILSRGE